MKKYKFVHFLNSILFSLFALLLIWFIWSNCAIKKTEYIINIRQLPESFNGFTIAQVSDLHNTCIGKDNSRLLNKLQESRPDMIAITGDIVDCHRTDVSIAVSFVEEAMKIAPCYYVTGNHEATLDEDVYFQLEQALVERGVRVLRDETVSFSRGDSEIYISGLDDSLFSNQEITADKILSLTDSGKFTLLLCHRPDCFEEFVKAEALLVLSGHTHGGQFRLPLIGGLIAPGQGLFPEYDAGLFHEGKTYMVISCGIGNSLMPIRFNNPPELVIIELHNN